MTESSDAPLVFLVAGEPSGDNLAARLAGALREAAGGEIRFAGVGGPRLAEQGVASLFPMADLAVMGLAEVLPHLPVLVRRMRETVAAVERLRPAVVVTIDSPGFTLRLAHRLRRTGVPIVHYVAPQAWAWRPGRAREMAGLVDHVMALLPFEPEFFARYGVDCAYVGHPLIESGVDQGDGDRFRARHRLGEAPVLTMLPGSRRSETSRLLPVYRGAVALLARAHPDLVVAMPAVEGQREAIAQAVADWPVKVIQVVDPAEKADAYAASLAAACKSGTSTLELALAGLPMVVCYRVARLTGWLARRVIQVPHVAMVNLLAGRAVVPELLQQDCTPERLAAELATLLDDPNARAAQKSGIAEAVATLGDRTPPPSRRAADFVLGVVRGETR